ncbi:terminase small subunit [Marinobacterium marinum]|uniref:Uncharacterized protein n=1 Tax=Marinobacterium marinum TaxID=2756129 RepID=A0A7W2AB95_9GAMM|nr:terminase small subunit [Marinobacterium marinum]MBA4501840.1 hypothetical protein [Marinobacterium marinum]
MANIGRPRVFQNPGELESGLNDYLQHCEDSGEPKTITGLCLFLGLSSRAALDDYAGRDGFGDAVARCKLAVEHGYELRLHGDGASSGAVFALKNFGWSDRRELDHQSSDGSHRPPAAQVVVTEADIQSILDRL